MEVYIDGACKNNGKTTAKASYGVFWEQNSSRNINGLVPVSYKQTNNTGELLAAAKCLQQVHENNITDITIKSDSEYLIRGITHDIIHWKNNSWKLKSSGNDVKNKQIWSEIDNLSTGINISWVHTPRDSEPGQIEADKLAKCALNIKTDSSSNTIQVPQQTTQNECTDAILSDDDSETIPMKVATPRLISTNVKARKVSNKTSSPSISVISTLRRIESLLLSTAEDVSNLNDTINCHIDSTHRQFQEIQDKFAALSNTVKVQTSSAIASVEEVCTQTQLIKSEMDLNSKSFVDKSKGLCDKINTVFQEVKSIKYSNKITPQMNNENGIIHRDTPTRKRKDTPSTSTKTATPGTYSNAVKRGLQYKTRPSSLTDRTGNFIQKGIQQTPNTRRNGYQGIDIPAFTDSDERTPNIHNTGRQGTAFPAFTPSNDRKNLFLIGSSTLKRMSARKMSNDKVTTKVKTIRGGRIRDIEDCLIHYISEGKLDYVDVIAVHVGTNNVSDGDSVHAIIDDYRNLIYTVKQNLPRTKLLISSILPRPTNYHANQTIVEVNNQLWSLEEPQVKVLDNTLNFIYDNQPNQSLFQDHVHTNIDGAKTLSHNIISTVYNMFGFIDTKSQNLSNFHSERITGRRFVPFNTNNYQYSALPNFRY